MEGMRRELGLWQDRKRDSRFFGFGGFGLVWLFEMRLCSPHKLGELHQS